MSRLDTSWIGQPALAAVNALAAYRLTRVWTRDQVPPMPAIRRWLGTKLDAYEDAHHGKPHPLQPLTDCPWCVGFWAALGVVALATLPTRRAWTPLAAALAASAITGHLSERAH